MRDRQIIKAIQRNGVRVRDDRALLTAAYHSKHATELPIMRIEKKYHEDFTELELEGISIHYRVGVDNIPSQFKDVDCNEIRRRCQQHHACG